MKIKLYTFLFLTLGITVAFALEDNFINDLKEKLQQYQVPRLQEKIYLHTDRNLYNPTDEIWFKAYLADANTNQMASVSGILHVELVNPKGNIEKQLSLTIEKGKATGSFPLQNIAGGIYKIRAYTNWMKNFEEAYPFEKEITIQQAILPSFLLKLDFDKKAYGANDSVIAKLEAKDLKNIPLNLANVKYSIQLAGKEYLSNTLKTSLDGKCRIGFKLPATLASNDGIINIIVEDNFQTESITRSIPIQLGNITLQFFPEGGNLVENIESKIAFEALNEFNKPADIEGEIIDEAGNTIQNFKSYHQGMGNFSFKGLVNKKYKAVITKPTGIAKTYELPTLQTQGFVLNIDTIDQQGIKARINASQAENIYLVVQNKGKIFYAEQVNVKVGENNFIIPTKDFPIGIAQLTLFDSQKRPRNERLVFLHRDKQLKIQIYPNKKQYNLREKVDLVIKTTTEDGRPTAANLSLAVVNDKNISLIDDKQDNILSHMLLSAELKGKIDEPNFYFKKDEPKAPVALDHLLLIRGWRRFTWQDVFQNKPFIAAYNPEQPNMIAGKVVDKKGKPVKATITLLEMVEQGRAVQVMTDTNGRFIFTGIDRKRNPKFYAIPQNKKDKGSINIIFDEKDKKKNIQAKNNDVGSIVDIMSTPIISEVYKNDMPVADYENRLMNNESLSDVVVTRSLRYATQNISGKIAGVQITNSTDTESSFAIKLRGVQSLNSQEPLIVIDGLPINTTINTLNLSADNIQTIQILKGAAGASIYGSAGANGVLFITTKKYTGYNNLKIRISPYTSADMPYYQVDLQQKEFYSPNYETKQNPEKREDFRETIYWNPDVQTDANGVARVSFYNSDENTTFRIIAEGIDRNGEIGREEQTYATVMPFTLEVKMPNYITTNDTLQIPIYIKNNTNEILEGYLSTSLMGKTNITLLASHDSLNRDFRQIKILPKTAQKILIACTVNSYEKIRNEFYFRLLLYGNLHGWKKESITAYLDAIPNAFPVYASFSDITSGQAFTIPIKNAVSGSLQASFEAYPNLITELFSGLESIFREPHGCFEQVSSSTYPNILALQLLNNKAMPSSEKVRNTALKYIKEGYKKLTNYEVAGGGFELYGKSPASPWLTAYGLMEFTDMKKVYPEVDEKMIERTKEWLLNKYKGDMQHTKPTYTHDPYQLHNTYILYALSEIGVKELDKEFEMAYEEALKKKDPYYTALVVHTAFNLEKKEIGEKLLDMLKIEVLTQELDKISAKTSVTYSQGISLRVETISLIGLALLKSSNPDENLLNKITYYLAQNRNYGSFGSTQATVLALKFLVNNNIYSQLDNKNTENIALDLKINDNTLHKDFNPTTNIYWDNLEASINTQKEQKIQVKYSNFSKSLPYSFNLSYRVYTPSNSLICPVEVKTSLSKSIVKLQENVRFTAIVKNKTDKEQPMPIAIVGIPAGLSPQIWQLKELQEKNIVDFYEIHNNYLVLYYRKLKPNAVQTINLDLKADFSGTFQAPASSAYLYYYNEEKNWIMGEKITILEQ